MNNIEKQVSTSYIRKKTVLGLISLLAFLTICWFAWAWIHKQPNDNRTPKPLRAVLNTNESIFTSSFGNKSLSKTFSKEDAAKNVRVNGAIGMETNLDSAWRLQVVRSPGDTLFISMDEIKSLPKTEVVFNFKCIEGWSQVTWWGGVKYSDFIDHFHLQKEVNMQYTGMHTPDNKYYVGLDNKSMLHPQTLLCYELNGKALPMNQGYPLRLIIPVKYGVKHLKRIGTIFFSNERPPDYWYERGYDYYCGL
ncbi:MAG: molybdopterin-dependent oxidoreductase [Ferruginibacter sp.]